ncbi:MAG: hypothetical protein ABJB12_24480 [Pseudomonadota bacterium]
MSSPYTTFGLPPDGVAWAALAAAGALVPMLHERTRRALGALVPARVPLAALVVTATLLSAGYVLYYLRGGPRIIDATSYYLQARALARGDFAFPVLAPSGAFRGRFLLENTTHSLSVIFPPGYAALLALGFLARAPMATGPLLAGALVAATYALAKELSDRDDIAIVAAALSTLCAALRYHTADTMSHGLCALLLCTGAWLALRARAWDALLCGLAIGWLIATRPITGGIGVLLACALLPRGPRAWSLFAAGLIPGLSLLLLYQHAATGSYWHSTQLSYYALADGPPGCFRYGFGHGIGCLYEHGEYVRARLAHGYGLREAASVTIRRLAIHCMDIANAAPLALLVPLGAWFGRRARGVWAIFLGCLGLICAYAPFYFDASYPGGGARLFAELLPLEHVLLAVAIVRLRLLGVALPLSLVGFAVHVSFAHRALAERDGGRPLFDARELARAGVSRGLVFIDTDHGFNLGHDPGQFDAADHVIVARYQHDAHDWLLWNRLHRPASYHYVFSATAGGAAVSVLPYAPLESQRFEAEAEWPPLGIQSGWVQPDFYPCASGGRGLRLHTTGPGAGAALTLELPVGDGSPHALRIGWVRQAGPETVLRLSGPGFSRGAVIPAGSPDCQEADLGAVVLPAVRQQIRLEASQPGIFDYLDVRP